LIFGLSNALPKSWRAFLNSETTDSDSTDFTEFIFHSKTGDINLIQLASKKLYKTLVEDIHIPPTTRLKYNSIYSNQDLTGNRFI